MRFKVLLVEDDHIQRTNVRQAIEKALEADVETMSTESDFQRDFESIAAHPPQMAVIDVMLRWANPGPDMPAAPVEVMNSPEHAGLRCAQLLRDDVRTGGVKVFLYSVLSNDGFGAPPPQGTECLVKELDYQNLMEALTNHARELTLQQRAP